MLKYSIMIKTMSGLLPLLTMIGSLSLQATAQQVNEEALVNACLENYMSGEANRMEKAFHPSASMKYVDYETGTYKDVPIAEFIARLKTRTEKVFKKAELVSLNIEGTAAQAKIRVEIVGMDNTITSDYMNLLKIDGEWKIVSKIFSRKNK